MSKSYEVVLGGRLFLCLVLDVGLELVGGFEAEERGGGVGEVLSEAVEMMDCCDMVVVVAEVLGIVIVMMNMHKCVQGQVRG